MACVHIVGVASVRVVGVACVMFGPIGFISRWNVATQKYWNPLSAQFHERQGTAETGSGLVQSGASAPPGLTCQNIGAPRWWRFRALAPLGGDVSERQRPKVVTVCSSFLGFLRSRIFFINKVYSVKYSILFNQSLTVQQESQRPIRWQQLRPDWSVLVFKSQPSLQTQLPPPPQYLHLVPIQV